MAIDEEKFKDMRKDIQNIMFEESSHIKLFIDIYNKNTDVNKKPDEYINAIKLILSQYKHLPTKVAKNFSITFGNYKKDDFEFTAKYAKNSGTFTLHSTRKTITTITPEEREAKNKASFEKYAEKHGLKPSDYGIEFKDGDVTCKIIGVKDRVQKLGVKVQRPDGRYNYGAKYVLRLLGRTK